MLEHDSVAISEEPTDCLLFLGPREAWLHRGRKLNTPKCYEDFCITKLGTQGARDNRDGEVQGQDPGRDFRKGSHLVVFLA